MLQDPLPPLPGPTSASVSLRASLSPSTCQTPELRDGSLFSIRQKSPHKLLKWGTPVIVPVTPRELPASEVHPSQTSYSWVGLVGGSDPFLPGFRKVTGKEKAGRLLTLKPLEQHLWPSLLSQMSLHVCSTQFKKHPLSSQAVISDEEGTRKLLRCHPPACIYFTAIPSTHVGIASERIIK